MRCFLVLLLVLPMAAADPKMIERGKYLVENVALCGDCHTPKTDKGALDRSKWLKGAVLDFQPLGAAPANWKKTTPDLTAGSRLWVKWGELSMLKYLTTGMTPKGEPSAPPMPAYKFNRADAEAVLEYLKSIR